MPSISYRLPKTIVSEPDLILISMEDIDNGIEGMNSLAAPK